LFISDKYRITITKGDITKENVDAIVNAANSSLLGGNGVDGAIHAAGGSQILEECKDIAQKIGKLDIGEAVITSGGDLVAKHVIHTVGPIWQGGENKEEVLLANAYSNCLKLAGEKKIKTIAFPSISTGVYGFPKELAAKIAFDTVNESLENYEDIEEVKFICFDNYSYKLYLGLLKNDMKERIKALLEFIPYFEDEKIEFTSWVGGEKNKNGVITMAHPKYDVGIINFIEAVGNSGIMMDDYLGFVEDKIGINSDINSVVKGGSLDTLRAILTYYVREEKFCDGTWGKAAKDKVFLNILKTMDSLLKNIKSVQYIITK